MDAKTRALYFQFFNEVGILSQLGRALMDQRLPDGFIVAHFSVLNHLIRRGDGVTPLDLARAFQVPKTTMTHTLSGLSKAGLIVFSPNPLDGRSKCVWITEAGYRFRDEAIAALNPDIDQLATSVSQDEIAELVPKLTRIREILDAARDRPAPLERPPGAAAHRRPNAEEA